jgi:hypothetical protein
MTVFPMQPGIFAIVPEKGRFGGENDVPNQALAGQFPKRG